MSTCCSDGSRAVCHISMITSASASSVRFGNRVLQGLVSVLF